MAADPAIAQSEARALVDVQFRSSFEVIEPVRYDLSGRLGVEGIGIVTVALTGPSGVLFSYALDEPGALDLLLDGVLDPGAYTYAVLSYRSLIDRGDAPAAAFARADFDVELAFSRRDRCRGDRRHGRDRGLPQSGGGRRRAVRLVIPGTGEATVRVLDVHGRLVDLPRERGWRARASLERDGGRRPRSRPASISSPSMVRPGAAVQRF